MAARFVILSSQRAGTTMLVHDLRSHPEVHCYGELFRRVHTGPNTYGGFRGLLPWRPPGGYLDRVYDRPEQAVGLKIMYNQLRWPLLKSALRSRDVRIVHLVRVNLLKQHVSHLVAVKRQLFAATTAPPAILIECPIDDLVGTLRRHRRLTEEHRAICGTFEHTEVHYEDFLADRSGQHRSLLTFLAVDPDVPLEGGRVKLNADRLEAVVSNYAEVVRELKGTEFQSLLD